MISGEVLAHFIGTFDCNMRCIIGANNTMETYLLNLCIWLAHCSTVVVATRNTRQDVFVHFHQIHGSHFCELLHFFLYTPPSHQKSYLYPSIRSLPSKEIGVKELHYSGSGPIVLLCITDKFDEWAT